MRLVKALVVLKIARSGSEAQRFIKQGAIMVGGCIPPCNGRMPPYKCKCDGWRKAANPTEDVPAGRVIRMKDGNWRLMKRLDNSNGFDECPGIGWVPDDDPVFAECVKQVPESLNLT